MYGGMREGEWWVNDLYATIAMDVINIEWEEKWGNEPNVYVIPSNMWLFIN